MTKKNSALLEWAIHLNPQNLSYLNIQMVVVVVCACLYVCVFVCLSVLVFFLICVHLIMFV